MARPYKRRGSRNYRGDIWYGGRKRSISLRTTNFGVARAKLHQLLATTKADGPQLPTKTPIESAVEAFVRHLAAAGTPKSIQTDIYRLREFFGPVCQSLARNSRVRRGRQDAPGDRRKPPKFFEFAVRVHFVEQVTTAMVGDFLATIKVRRSLEAKTVNEYREILHRFFNWAIDRHGVRLPGEPRTNPVSTIKRLRSAEPAIRFLHTIEAIHHQLDVLTDQPQIQTMVAVLIYAGVRRSELLDLTPADVDLGRKRIFVRRKVVAGVTYGTKTGCNRFVPISGALLPYLLRYRPALGCPWCFPSPQGAHWDPDNFSHRLGPLNKAAGLGLELPGFSAHLRIAFGHEGRVALQNRGADGQLAGDLPAALCLSVARVLGRLCGIRCLFRERGSHAF